MKVIKLSQFNQQEVIAVSLATLKAGGLIIYPTETVYGIGVDAKNQTAVNKLLSYKTRREGKPLSIAVDSQTMAEQYVELNNQAKILYQQFLPGPMTIVSIDRNQLARGVASEFGTLGIRIPQYPLISQIIKSFGSPITATSANASGKRRPYQIEHVLKHLSNKQLALLDLVIDAGTLPKKPPSVVIDTTLSTPIVMRSGELKSQITNIKSSNLQLISKDIAETQAIAGRLLLKEWSRLKNHPIIIGLDGSLGAGKTTFAQGVGKFLKISAPLVSPTYSYLEEYLFSRLKHQGTLIHADVWKIDSLDLLNKIQLIEKIKPNTILIIEWFNQIKHWVTKDIKSSKAILIEVIIEDDLQETTRKITIFN